MRRKFFDVHAATGSPIAKEALDCIGQLYAVEKTINGSPPDRRRQRREPSLALSIAFAAVATSQEVFAEASPSRPAVLVKTMTMDEVVQPDGSYTTVFHVERLATNQSAAQKIAQQTVEYSESMETAEIEEALTLKADGNVLKVDRTQIFAQAPPGSPQVPMFTDRKQEGHRVPGRGAG